ncbi:unnamed protein product [Amoebophrya sp. A120]|nr:unnamed protein product [Amoebophrya sp. A120]|eukprot:GSA120T00016745001.1
MDVELADQEVLVVGDGDLSFSCSFALHINDIKQLTATVYEKEDEFRRRYGEMSETAGLVNLKTLEMYGCNLLFGVDATNIYDSLVKSGVIPAGSWEFKKYDCVLWNFPYPIEWRAWNVKEKSTALLRNFFASARHFVKAEGHLRIALLMNQYDNWRIEESSLAAGLRLERMEKFEKGKYKYYCNRYGDDREQTVQKSADYIDRGNPHYFIFRHAAYVARKEKEKLMERELQKRQLEWHVHQKKMAFLKEQQMQRTTSSRAWPVNGGTTTTGGAAPSSTSTSTTLELINNLTSATGTTTSNRQGGGRGGGVTLASINFGAAPVVSGTSTSSASAARQDGFSFGSLVGGIGRTTPRGAATNSTLNPLPTKQIVTTSNSSVVNRPPAAATNQQSLLEKVYPPQAAALASTTAAVAARAQPQASTMNFSPPTSPVLPIPPPNTHSAPGAASSAATSTGGVNNHNKLLLQQQLPTERELLLLQQQKRQQVQTQQQAAATAAAAPVLAPGGSASVEQTTAPVAAGTTSTGPANGMSRVKAPGASYPGHLMRDQDGNVTLILNGTRPWTLRGFRTRCPDVKAMELKQHTDGYFYYRDGHVVHLTEKEREMIVRAKQQIGEGTPAAKAPPAAPPASVLLGSSASANDGNAASTVVDLAPDGNGNAESAPAGGSASRLWTTLSTAAAGDNSTSGVRAKIRSAGANVGTVVPTHATAASSDRNVVPAATSVPSGDVVISSSTTAYQLQLSTPNQATAKAAVPAAPVASALAGAGGASETTASAIPKKRTLAEVNALQQKQKILLVNRKKGEYKATSASAGLGAASSSSAKAASLQAVRKSNDKVAPASASTTSQTKATLRIQPDGSLTRVIGKSSSPAPPAGAVALLSDVANKGNTTTRTSVQETRVLPPPSVGAAVQRVLPPPAVSSSTGLQDKTRERSSNTRNDGTNLHTTNTETESPRAGARGGRDHAPTRPLSTRAAADSKASAKVTPTSSSSLVNKDVPPQQRGARGAVVAPAADVVPAKAKAVASSLLPTAVAGSDEDVGEKEAKRRKLLIQRAQRRHPARNAVPAQAGGQTDSTSDPTRSATLLRQNDDENKRHVEQQIVDRHASRKIYSEQPTSTSHAAEHQSNNPFHGEDAWASTDFHPGDYNDTTGEAEAKTAASGTTAAAVLTDEAAARAERTSKLIALAKKVQNGGNRTQK